MSKKLKLKQKSVNAYKSIIQMFFRIIGYAIKFIVLVIVALLFFIINNLHWICIFGASIWTGYLMLNEFGKAMAIFSFFVVSFLGCIVVNTEKIADNSERKNESNN